MYFAYFVVLVCLTTTPASPTPEEETFQQECPHLPRDVATGLQVGSIVLPVPFSECTVVLQSTSSAMPVSFDTLLLHLQVRTSYALAATHVEKYTPY